MNKLEKIEEIIREYNNGGEEISAEEIIKSIGNVLDDDRTYGTNDTLTVSTPAGDLCAYIGGDKDNPSVGLYLIPEGSDGAIVDLSYVEVKGEELMKAYNESNKNGEKITAEDVCLYTYADPYTEDFTQKNIIKRDDIAKALEIEENWQSMGETIIECAHQITENEDFRKNTPWIKGRDCTVISLNASDGDGMSHFRIDIKGGSVFAKGDKESGYILNSVNEISENTLFNVAMAVRYATGAEVFPISGIEPMSWKGELSDEHIKKLEEHFKPKTKENKKHNPERE